MALTSEHATAALRGVRDPDLGKDIVSLGFIKGVEVTGNAVKVKIELTTPGCPHKEVIERDARAALTQTGFADIQFEFTAQVRSSAPSNRKNVLPQVKNVIAVGAGKGGVGKSTIAVNLAVGLHRCGAAVGLMDGDIYGPSMPTMLGVKGVTPQVRGSKILPHHVHGIYAVTIGSLVEHDKPLIWRGPMAHGAFKQLLVDNTDWPELDYLIVDLPPGTGDVPLSLCQLLPLVGAVVVATPQQVALDDALRAVRMFEQLQTPVLGLVENMSYFVAPDGTEHDIFGRGGAKAAAREFNVPYLGAVPMVTELRVHSDMGQPDLNFTSSAILKQALEALVGNVAAEVSKRNMQTPAPELRITG
jgi:ATP-binding protein involved in chromosome partitioning